MIVTKVCKKYQVKLSAKGLIYNTYDNIYFSYYQIVTLYRVH